MRDTPLVSIVVPVWRDVDALEVLLGNLDRSLDAEVIVATVLAENAQYEPTRTAHPHVRWVRAPRGRGVQMNAGAAVARGRWLLFLHADSRLSNDWMDAIRAADPREDVVGGSYRLTLDSPKWFARIIEAVVRARVSLLDLPYGDQALFVRRATFEALGGYRDLPLMEDIDLMRRLTRAGRLCHSRSPVLTSARRWERDGWARRSAENAALAALFLAGISPARLARRYARRRAEAVVMMARAPWVEGKTRLRGSLDDVTHRELREALFLDTLDVARSVSGVEHVIACEPADACEAMRETLPDKTDVIAQRGLDLGDRLANVFEDVFRLGSESVVVIGSDLPDLHPRHVSAALRALRGGRSRLVLGPATDGGYYLIGLRRLAPELFHGIDWGSGQVWSQTMTAARRIGLDVVLLEPWSDIDDIEDLERLRTKPADGSAPRCREWLSTWADAAVVGKRID